MVRARTEGEHVVFAGLDGGEGDIANLKITLHIAVFETEYELNRNMKHNERARVAPL